MYLGKLIILQLCIELSIIHEKNLLLLVNNESIKNIKTYSGPMGMGLAKSFEVNGKKICIYNTIQGQKKIELNKKKTNCPKNILEANNN